MSEKRTSADRITTKGYWTKSPKEIPTIRYCVQIATGLKGFRTGKIKTQKTMEYKMTSQTTMCDWCGGNIPQYKMFWRDEKEDVDVCKNCGDKAKYEEEQAIYGE